MTKNLRAEMSEEAFYEFKGLFGELDVDTNDEAVEKLVEEHEEVKELIDDLESALDHRDPKVACSDAVNRIDEFKDD